MKNYLVPLFLLFLAGCGHTSTTTSEGPAKLKGGGRSLPVTVTATAKGDAAGRSVFLVPKDEEDTWTKEDKRCVTDLYHALELSGFPRAASKEAADLRVIVDLPAPAKATGFNIVAFMGGYKHLVGLEAQDKSGKTAWTAQAAVNQESELRRPVFPFLALSLVGKAGTNINGEDRVDVDEFDPRFDKINAP